ncbi:alpha/beta hydrolase [Salinifilum ghardaiensis]
MPRCPRRVLAVLSLLALLAVTGCSAGPSQRPAVAVRGDGGEQQVPPQPQAPEPPPVPPLGPPAQGVLHWDDCTDRTLAEIGRAEPSPLRFSCARMLSPLDAPEQPVRGITQTALVRTGSGDIPLVLLSGVRGEPGTAAAARLAHELPRELLETYTLIGVDRRGTGESDAAECIPPHQRETIVGFDPKAAERARLDELLASVRNASQQCLLSLDERLQAYDTQRTAADLESLRRELGVPRLHMLARGEASRLALTYAEQHPRTTGRMVLDGALDPQRDAVGRAEDEARASEAAFDAFAEDCASSGSCALGPDPRAVVSGLVERTRQRPLPAGGTEVSAGDVVRAIQLELTDRAAWPRLAEALSAAVRGDGRGIAEILAPLVRGRGESPPRLDGELITTCNDTTQRVPPERVAHHAADWVNRFPLFGGIAAQQLAWCSQWPVPQQPLPEPEGRGIGPVPVVSTAVDPYLRQVGSEHMARRLPSGVLLRWQGAGHGALAGSPCIARAVTRFLVSGTPPPDDMVCPE